MLYFVLEFVENVSFRRRVVKEDGQLLQLATVGVRSRLYMTAHIVHHDVSLREFQPTLGQIVGVEEIRQNAITSVVQLAVYNRSVVRLSRIIRKK